MTKLRSLAIVPTYNEVENIPALVDGLMAVKPPVDVLVVDDGSPDGTADAARSLGERFPGRIHLLERPGKMGLGTAYLDGFRFALREGYDIAITMDADLSHNPRHLGEMLHVAKIADLVIGSRYIAGGGLKNWGAHRKLLSWTANTMARMVGGLRARDCTSGYRCYRTTLLRQLDLEAIRSNGYSCLMELLAVCQAAGARVREVPIVFHDREAGKSKISHVEILKALATLWRLRLHHGKT